jgi:hypothetical protein
LIRLLQAIPVYHTMTGVDISQEMVNFANKAYADETVSFQCMDIAAVSNCVLILCITVK